MKCIHLSDLHIGKQVNGFSMLKDQAYILQEIASLIEQEQVDVVLISGDIYDRSIPPIEAVSLLDDFLVKIATKNRKIYLISGNHDSEKRLSFLGSLLKEKGIYFSKPYEEGILQDIYQDEYGEVGIYLLPFLKPSSLQKMQKTKEIRNTEEAVQFAIENMHVPSERRNLLLAHQFVLGGMRSDSEEILFSENKQTSVGGSDAIRSFVFDAFDYVALGHLHRPQKMARNTLRYCGSPLAYSFSESEDEKSVTLLEWKEKGNLSIRTLPLHPKRRMRKIKGSYLEVSAKSFYAHTNQEDYLHITLTDEEDIPDALAKLRILYPNVMQLAYDNKRSRKNQNLTAWNTQIKQSPLALFEDLYRLQNNQDLNAQQSTYLESIMKTIWEETE